MKSQHRSSAPSKTAHKAKQLATTTVQTRAKETSPPRASDQDYTPLTVGNGSHWTEFQEGRASAGKVKKICGEAPPSHEK